MAVIVTMAEHFLCLEYNMHNQELLVVSSFNLHPQAAGSEANCPFQTYGEQVLGSAHRERGGDQPVQVGKCLQGQKNANNLILYRMKASSNCCCILILLLVDLDVNLRVHVHKLPWNLH